MIDKLVSFDAIALVEQAMYLKLTEGKRECRVHGDGEHGAGCTEERITDKNADGGR